ncbi:hypothetical protein VNO77_22334 [Canavalia gladiata]|uniref:Uncharacterized protein n=1 Tax=Canavalia gladiata TaxID=3824 RepID=A0AAN9QAP6_CANGL
MWQLCSGVDENAIEACSQLVFAPIGESFADDALLLPSASGFCVILSDPKSILGHMVCVGLLNDLFLMDLPVSFVNFDCLNCGTELFRVESVHSWWCNLEANLAPFLCNSRNDVFLY